MRLVAGFLLLACFSVSTPQTARADSLEAVGDAFQFAVPALGLYALNQENGRDGLWSCAKAIGITALSTHALKAAIDAPRPNGGGHGFPSGRTSSAAVGFGCVLGQEGWTDTSITLGAASLITAYSRVESDHHSWDQVVAGFALGTAIGYYSTRHLRDDMQINYGITARGDHSLSFQMEF